MTEKKGDLDVTRTAPAPAPEWEPMRALRHQMDRLMADLDWPGKAAMVPQMWRQLGAAVPPVDLVERNGGYELQAELPGMTEDQIEVKLANGMVTIKGEKSSERVEDEDDYHLRERSFGAFQRSFRVPENVDADKIEARFDKGVLKIILPKSAAALQEARKIAVKAA